MSAFLLANHVTYFSFSLSFPVFFYKSSNFPEILTIFQVPRVFQIFHVFQVCGHPGSFYHECLRTEIKTNADKFAISSHAVLKLAILVLKSYFQAIT